MKAPARIALIGPHFEEYCLLFANALAEDGEVLLCVEKDRLVREYAGRRMPVPPNVTIHDTKFSSPFGALALWIALARFRPTAVHIQEAAGLVRAITCIGAAVFARLFSKLVLTVHDPQPHSGRDARIAQRLALVRDITRRAAQVVCVHGQYCNERYRSLGFSDRQQVVVIDHGAILVGDSPAVAADPTLRILVFGRMEHYKGLAVLLDAVRICAGEGTDFTLEIAGQGPELDRLLDEFGPISQVTVRNGYVPASEIIDAIDRTNCIVLPYLSATQSGVLAAAVANGRCVIASRTGGLVDVIEDMDSGLLVPPNDPQALAAAIKSAASNPDLRRSLQHGALRVAASKLDWRVIARKVTPHYG